MIRRVFSCHQEIMEKMLEHRGSVVNALTVNAYPDQDFTKGQMRFVQPPVSVQMLSNTGFHDSMVRQAQRARGKPIYEPEQES